MFGTVPWQQFLEVAMGLDQTTAQTELRQGCTPSSLVYRERKMVLRHYGSPDRSGTPIVMVPSLINRYYIMDLMPGQSLVSFLVSAGFDVYMVDWGIPDQGDSDVSFGRYVCGYLSRCIDCVMERSGRSQVSMLGYCMGGLFAVCYAALFPADVRNLISLAGAVNYHDDGKFSLWTRAMDVDVMVNRLGNIPPELLALAWKLMQPTADIMQQVVFYERLNDEAFVNRFQAMQTWVNDNIPFPGEVFRQYVKDLYQQNLLIENGFALDGHKVSLSAIDASLLIVAMKKDHIAPHESVTCLDRYVSSSDKTTMLLPGGHIGAVAGSGARNRLWPDLAQWLLARSR